MENHRIVVTLFRWAGAWGPFKVNIPCGERSLSKDVILDTLSTELAGIPVDLDIREWLSEWWKPLLKGGWHAPIVMVEGKVIAQGHALNRGVLTQAVIEAYSHTAVVTGNHLFGKESCPHCKRAKGYLEKAGISYTYHDVVKNPHDLYEMLARVKPIIGPKTPITVPQIWIEGSYIGGADQLSKIVQQNVTPNFDRGKCSLSPENRKLAEDPA
ncbi:glutaredoxin [Sedimenticola selenatireducens]|uniref:glutaredoxin family protein n=1 Tax=Sedimenticola selenatireducens TaxID=191960 RepID=UPI002AABEB2E|nr:glutaredoxin [Sedimenticola selenatireducens]